MTAGIATASVSGPEATGTAQHLEKKPDLFIDRLWRGLLTEPVLLVTENRNLGDVGDDLCAEKTADVSERIFGKGC